jgi:hypothetical protein
LSDFEELEARSPSPRRGGAARAFGRFAVSAASHHVDNSKRDLGKPVEEIEARSFDEPIDIDLMIRELGSSEEDGLYL